ncbi:MAG TPA: OmpA family protein [Verrucomicrobiaceae bacterium]
MKRVRQAGPAQRGNALAPILIILGALAVSGLLFYFFTLKKIEDNRKSADTEKSAATSTPAEVAVAPENKKETPTQGDNSTSKSSAKSATTEAAHPKAPPTMVFRKPVDLARELTRALAEGDVTGAAKMISPDETAKQDAARRVLEKVFGELGYKPGTPEQAQMIGQVENMIRVTVPLAPRSSGESPSRIMLDLERDPRRGWKVSQIHLPKELESALAALPQSAPADAAAAASGAPAPPSIATPAGAGRMMDKSLFVVDRSPDALVFASDFVDSLLKLDYVGARRFVDQDKIPPVKLAALCIVFEEGKYRLADDRALVATVATDTTSWVITRVISALTNNSTEFGLEMEKTGDEWRVGGLNLSKLLSDNAKVTSAGEVPYSPLVMNPKGGESIALFFELNQAELHPRAKKQLDVVVSILKASPQKKLRIGGYTDALGSDAYNLNLSQRRAEAVKQYFLASGVPPAQVETTGFGKSLPLSPNVHPDGTDNPEGRSRNRRAEILLDF